MSTATASSNAALTTAPHTGFSGPFGRFDDQNREYVIDRPDTPLPWINYLGAESFHGIISNTAGGYCFSRDARLRRLTRYRYNNVPLDSNGRYLYIRDRENTSAPIWNPGWKPCRAALDAYECRHGLGYTTIRGQKDGIAVVQTCFVPQGLAVEIWDVTIENTSDRPRSISLFGFVEWCLWDAHDDATNFQRNFSIGEVETGPGVIFHTTEYRERRDHYAFFDCTAETAGFDTARDAFIGVHDGLDAPRAVLAGACTNSHAHGWAPIGAHQIDLDLAPGEHRRFQFRLGYCEHGELPKFAAPHQINREPYERAIASLTNDAAVDRARADLAAFWERTLSSYQADIDEPGVTRMANTWNAYQCMVTFFMSRSASLYESGIGRGMGYRDSNQDTLGMVHMAPDRVRERLCDLAATQLSDGTCFHQYQPLTKKGNADVGGGFNDDPLWLIHSVCAYIKETGDRSILDEPVGYADDEERGHTGPKATVLDHLERSLAYTAEHRGPHRLPLIGHADWNDCLNLNCFSTTPGESFQLAGDIEGGIAESVMIAGLYCASLREMAALWQHLGQEPKAGACDTSRADMHQVVLKHGWDGAWFRRAYDADGALVGSDECDEGKIFIEPQGWCIMAGIGLDDGKARAALDSVAEHLKTAHGVVLQQPAYQTYHLSLGEISSYPPGYKENAGIFAHSNTWIQVAETILGRGDEAWDYYRSICPAYVAGEHQGHYRCEPYVYAQMIAGKDAPNHGEAKNSWLTGTAAWTHVVLTHRILGVRPTFDGLVIDPCVPTNAGDAWREFRVERRWRDKTYAITIRDPNGVGSGVARCIADGQDLDRPVVPHELGTERVDVEVTLGREVLAPRPI